MTQTRPHSFTFVKIIKTRRIGIYLSVRTLIRKKTRNSKNLRHTTCGYDDRTYGTVCLK